MYSYLYDPPDPNFQLSFVKIGMSVICAVLIKFSPKFYIYQFHDIHNPSIFCLLNSKKTSRRSQFDKKRGGGLRGGMIKITD